jgi:hypothetical protein
MNNELVKRKELAFQIYEVLDTENLCERKGLLSITAKHLMQ